jgi:PAS domain S-box-containing protein
LIGERAHRALAQSHATAEEKLCATEARFRSAIMAAPFPAVIHADDGQMLDINGAWSEMSGYTRAEIPTVAAWLEKAYDEPERSQVQSAITRLCTIEDWVEQTEFNFRTASGERRAWCFGAASLGRDELGRRLVVCVASDVTPLRQAEEALRESLARLADIEDRLRFSLTSAQAGCSEWDARNDRRSWPEGPHQVQGFDGSVRDISFDSWIDTLNPDDRAPVLAYIDQRFAQRAEDYCFEYRVGDDTVGVRWIRAKGRITYDDAGAPIRMASPSTSPSRSASRRSASCCSSKCRLMPRRSSDPTASASPAPTRTSVADAPSAFTRVDEKELVYRAPKADGRAQEALASRGPRGARARCHGHRLAHLARVRRLASRARRRSR